MEIPCVVAMSWYFCFNIGSGQLLNGGEATQQVRVGLNDSQNLL